ncbi:MAG: pilus assembly protein [Actinomycetota bacterium]|nr:pilus assembly protein [Actinomycetota bacterium]
MLERMRARSRPDDGASAVEFALVFPILIVLVFGIISFGVLFAQQLALNNGVRQGARLIVVEGSPTTKTCAAAVTAVRDSTGPAIAMNTADINVLVQRTSSSPCGSGNNPTSGTVVCTNSINVATSTQQSVVITATYRADLIMIPPIPGFPSGFDLTSKAVYKCEFN